MASICIASKPFFMEFAHFIRQPIVLDLLVSWLFLATIPKTTQAHTEDDQSTKNHQYSLFTSNLLQKVVTIAAFLLRPISVPTRLKTAAIALPFFEKIAKSPLSLSHILAITTALTTIPQIITYKQGLSTEPDKIEKFGHFLSSIAFSSIGLVAFEDIGTWKQTVATGCVFSLAYFASNVPIALIKSRILNNLAHNSHEDNLKIGISPIIMALTGSVFRKLSWLPKSGANLTTAITGLGCALYTFTLIFKKPSSQKLFIPDPAQK